MLPGISGYSIQKFMALRAVDLAPESADINRMTELECLPYLCIFHLIGFALTNYGMAKIAVPGDLSSVFRSEGIIMTPEASFCFKMPDMVRVRIIGNLHPRKSVFAEGSLQGGHRTVNFFLIILKIIAEISLVVAGNSLSDLHQSRVLVSESVSQDTHCCSFDIRDIL